MNYTDIERQTFKTFLVFSTFVLTTLGLFFNLASSIYRVSQISFEENKEINFSSLDDLLGTSIWLVDDYYFDAFYDDNPKVEQISIRKDLPNGLLVEVTISESIIYIEDSREVPKKTSILYKNLYVEKSSEKDTLATLLIENGPVREGFYEEVITLIMTLKKYSINLQNIQIIYDGENMFLKHLDTEVSLGAASDLARKASVVGYYISESPCRGEVRLIYSEDGNEIRAITNCQ